MDPMQIVLIVLALAGIWAVVELALTLRRSRGMVDSLDKTVNELNSTIEEARPVVAKLDGVVDELQPAIAQVEPLLKKAGIAVEALSADLVEINGVLRDVSAVSGTASAATNAVNGIADAASEKMQKLLGRSRKDDARPSLTEAPHDGEDQVQGHEEPVPEPVEQRYFTYDSAEDGGARDER